MSIGNQNPRTSGRGAVKHEEIIAMAKEAGLSFVPEANSPLVRIVRKAVAKEREACAQVCDAERQDFGGVAAGPMTTDAGKRVHEAMAAGAATCAAAIRARGQKEGT